MSLNFTPRVGQVLECNYGNYGLDAAGRLTNHVDGHIQPEMVKNRLVVVLNGKLSATACLVVPLSTTLDRAKTTQGIHVELAADSIEALSYFQPAVRWAKADMVEQVSRQRLFRPHSARGRADIHLERDAVELVQRAVIKAINAASLLQPRTPPAAPQAVTPASGLAN